MEMVAVMAKYNPFAERAGMQKISEQPSSKKALAIATVLSELGLNIQLLGSEKYVLNELRTLKLEDVARIYPKNRNVLRKGQYHQIEADSPEKLLRKLLETKHKAWYEIYRVEIIRKIRARGAC